MSANDEIVNRVTASALVTFDLEEFYVPGERVMVDIKDQLYQGLVLREKDFRNFVREHDWSQYEGKFVAVTCSADAIIPNWAYMLVGVSLQPVARKFIFGSLADLEIRIFLDQLSGVDWEKFNDVKVVVKGCSKVDVPPAVYVEAVAKLRPYAASIMFGEPCSTVPLYKKKSK